MNEFTNADDQEIIKFDKVAKIWWDEQGKMGMLHTINPLRAKFILDNVDTPYPRMLDIGCGGGILTEALAKSGAHVTGIDLSQPTLAAARLHASAQGLQIDYRYQNAEQIAQQEAGSFDAVTCMEMLEHVPDPAQVVAACAQLLKPGGRAFFSTINRTPKAFLFAIVGAEYVLHMLPRGTHSYQKLIRPQELRNMARASGLEFVSVASLMYNPFSKKFKVAAGKEDVNYMAYFIKNGNPE